MTKRSVNDPVVYMRVKALREQGLGLHKTAHAMGISVVQVERVLGRGQKRRREALSRAASGLCVAVESLEALGAAWDGGMPA